MKKQLTEVSFKINNKDYSTILSKNSKNLFEKLLKQYSKNVSLTSNVNDPNYLPVDAILYSAFDNLKNEKRPYNLIVKLMALNSEIKAN